MTTQQSKNDSILWDKIVRIDWEHAIELELSEECEGSADSGEEIEFWGAEENGDEWRVHLCIEK